LFPSCRKYAQSNIYVRYQESSRTNFEFTAILKRVETAEDYIAGPKPVRLILPARPPRSYGSATLEALDYAASDIDLGSLLSYILDSGANEPIQVRFLDPVWIVEHEVLKTDMSELLNNM
jgi:hypothetical protein